MMNRSIVLALSALSSLVGCSVGPHYAGQLVSAPVTPLRPGKEAPELRFVDDLGRSRRLYEVGGDVTLLVVLAEDEGGLRSRLRDLSELARSVSSVRSVNVGVVALGKFPAATVAAYEDSLGNLAYIEVAGEPAPLWPGASSVGTWFAIDYFGYVKARGTLSDPSALRRALERTAEDADRFLDEEEYR